MIMMSASEKAAAELDSIFEQVQVKYFFFKEGFDKKRSDGFFSSKKCVHLKTSENLRVKIEQKNC